MDHRSSCTNEDGDVDEDKDQVIKQLQAQVEELQTKMKLNEEQSTHIDKRAKNDEPPPPYSELGAVGGSDFSYSRNAQQSLPYPNYNRYPPPRFPPYHPTALFPMYPPYLEHLPRYHDKIHDADRHSRTEREETESSIISSKDAKVSRQNVNHNEVDISEEEDSISDSANRQEEKVRAAREKLEKMKKKQKEVELERLREQNRLLEEESLQSSSLTSVFDVDLDRERLKAENFKKRQAEISLVLEEMKKATIVDICFLLDCTKSMSPYIVEVKSKIQWLVDEIVKRHDVHTIKLAFVGYRDLCDGDKNLSVLYFTKSVKHFWNFLGKIHAGGGCSHTADVMGGLAQVSRLKWTAPASRILIHIGDAPGHGTMFHVRQKLKDPFPRGDPKGRKPESLLPILQNQTLISFYIFMRLRDLTDRMINRFKEITGDDWLKQMPLETILDLMPNALQSISATINSIERKTVSGLRLNSDKSVLSEKQFLLDENLPHWNDLEAEEVYIFEHKLPRMEPKLFARGGIDVDLLRKPLELTKKDRLVKITRNPFAKGGTRLAYFGRDVTPFPGKPSETSSDVCVLKEFLLAGGGINSKENYVEQIEVQAIGMHLALQFNKAKPKGTKEIKFLKESLVSFHKRGKPSYYTKEPKIDGEYTKFSNNWGYVNEKEYYSLLQTFSHWSYDITGGFLQVVDLQGVKSGEVFRLTDPVIHCLDVTRFTKTNLGVVGMERFFRTHTCNDICRQMRLLPRLAPKQSIAQ